MLDLHKLRDGLHLTNIYKKNRMKHSYFYFIIFLSVLIILPACNNEWEDELFTQMVSFKAPINKDDVSIIYVKYKPDNETVNFKVPVIVSGSRTNDKDYNVRIGVDNDTLNFLNIDKYSTRTDLYYKQLPENFYEFPTQTCHIPAGSDVATFDINFKLSGLDLVDKWILPLTILPDDSYKLNSYKGRQKALLWVMPFNDYSGSYNAGSMYVYFGDNTTKYMTANTREARVVDENTVFFYAGITEELAENRDEFKIKCKFLEPTEVTEIKDPNSEESTGLFVKKGKLVLSADNPEMEFEVIGEPTYEIREELDINRPHLIKRFFTLTMSYNYKDATASENMVFPYRCEGTMLLQRNISTLIPDEDQAVFW